MSATYHDGYILTQVTRGGIIDYEITSEDRDAVIRGMERVIREYHPSGYGTSFLTVREKDGLFRCVGWRASSGA